MYNREIIYNLRKWKQNINRKPLILRGARQVGKTTVVNLFSKEFKNYIYLNLDKNQDKDLFNKNLSIHDLFQSILLHKNIKLQKGETLLFIDEIQESKGAVKYLRYFFEEFSNLYVISAGSLFEISIDKTNINFPVGRVEYLFLFPLNFREWLNALEEDLAFDALCSVPISAFAHEKLLKLFHTYSLIGGMPEIVLRYKQQKNIINLKPIYQSLITSFKEDVGKYQITKNAQNIIRFCIENAPFEAGKRIKFQNFGNSNYRSREVGESLRTLEKAMLLYLIYPTISYEKPLIENKRKAPRLQFLDIGLMNYVVDLQSEYYKYNDLGNIYKGLLIEQIIGQELLSTDMEILKKPIFWVREKKQSTAEVDYLITYKNFIIPIEVKSGKTGTLRSLHQFMDKCNHPYAVRFYSNHLKIDKARTINGKSFLLLNLPYFLAGKLKSYIEWFVENNQNTISDPSFPFDALNEV